MFVRYASATVELMSGTGCVRKCLNMAGGHFEIHALPDLDPVLFQEMGAILGCAELGKRNSLGFQLGPVTSDGFLRRSGFPRASLRACTLVAACSKRATLGLRTR